MPPSARTVSASTCSAPPGVGPAGGPATCPRSASSSPRIRAAFRCTWTRSRCSTCSCSVVRMNSAGSALIARHIRAASARRLASPEGCDSASLMRSKASRSGSSHSSGSRRRRGPAAATRATGLPRAPATGPAPCRLSLLARGAAAALPTTAGAVLRAMRRGAAGAGAAATGASTPSSWASDSRAAGARAGRLASTCSDGMSGSSVYLRVSAPEQPARTDTVTTGSSIGRSDSTRTCLRRGSLPVREVRTWEGRSRCVP